MSLFSRFGRWTVDRHSSPLQALRKMTENCKEKRIETNINKPNLLHFKNEKKKTKENRGRHPNHQPTSHCCILGARVAPHLPEEFLWLFGLWCPSHGRQETSWAKWPPSPEWVSFHQHAPLIWSAPQSHLCLVVSVEVQWLLLMKHCDFLWHSAIQPEPWRCLAAQSAWTSERMHLLLICQQRGSASWTPLLFPELQLWHHPDHPDLLLGFAILGTLHSWKNSVRL